ncbi:MAG: hypothetical protein VX028_00330 [Nanoarchaeota archaeon]|nr:hypothetical protein [Nanoarchaeota archaeon]
MEETIWMIFGILAMLITLGIIGPLIYNQSTSFSQEKIDFQVKQILKQANFLCNTGPGNSFTIPITMYYNTTLYTNEDRVCMSGNDKISCQISKCEFEPYNFTFSNDLAKRLNSLEYQCSMEVIYKGSISLNCEG